MPIYEYKCKNDHKFEKLMKMSDPVPKCPECGDPEPVKQVSKGSFSLVGDGWYKDGYGLRTNEGE